MKNVSLTNLAAGTYTVTVTDDNGCTTTAAEEVKDGIPFMIIPIVDMGPVCPNTSLGPIVLQTNIWGADFTWKGGGTAGLADGGATAFNPIIPTFNAFGIANVTVTATMGLCKATEEFKITAEDKLAPKFANCPTVPVMELADPNNCSAKVNWSAPVATDNCGMVNTIQTGGPASGSAIPVGTHTITYTSSDMAGNTTTCTFTVMVMDSQAPHAVCKNIVVELGSNGSVTVLAAQLNGGSTDNCPGSLTYASSQTVFNAANVGTNVVTLTVTDAGGNTGTCTATVTIPTYCPQSGNESLLWNEAEFHDPLHNSQNLSESFAEVSWQLPYHCLKGNQYVRYELFLDLDGDGTTETVVSSKTAPESAGWVNFDNENTANYAGGKLVPFDGRNVPLDQKYRFDVEVKDTGSKYIATVRWTTAAEPNTYLTALIPLGLNHRIRWSMLDSCEDKYVQVNAVELRDCSKPVVKCPNGETFVDIGRLGTASVLAEEVLRSATDNCTPFEQLAVSIRRQGTGTGMPLTTGGLPVSKLTFTCKDLGVNPVEVWVADRSGNLEFCTMNVVVKDPNDACKNFDGKAEDRQDSEQTDEQEPFQLFQNRPNPFSDETAIGFYLPEAGAATLTIFDESGRMIYTAKGEYAKGDHSVTVSKSMLGNASGLLYYRVTTEHDSATRKMILTNR